MSTAAIYSLMLKLCTNSSSSFNYQLMHMITCTMFAGDAKSESLKARGEEEEEEANVIILSIFVPLLLLLPKKLN